MSSEIRLSDILANEALRQQEFPVTRHRTYLAHAAVCPLPARVAEAMVHYTRLVAETGQFEYQHRELETQTRELAAHLLEASSEEIAFVSSTSAGLSLVARGLDWKAGENVVIAEGDFPANIYPWLSLRRRGVQVRFIGRRPSGLVTLEDVANLVNERTRLVSLSTVHFSTGAPIDVDGIGEFLHKRGILFCLDAIQSLGALPCPIRHVDFLVADAHKWLLGPQGIGLFFVRRKNFEKLHPALLGWKSVRSPADFLRLQLDFPDSARRYEPGSLNIVGLVGLHGALSLMLAVGPAEISERLRALRSALLGGLRERDCEIVGIASSELRTGIASFRKSDEETTSLYHRLDEKGIIVSLRDDPCGRKCIRVSPHFYNTESEIQVLLQNL